MFYDILCRYGMLILHIVLFSLLAVVLYFFIRHFAVSPLDLFAFPLT